MTDQPWAYTAYDGATLTLIPGADEVLVRITAGAKTTEDSIPTAYLPAMAEALTGKRIWMEDMSNEMWCELTPNVDGMMLSLSESPDAVEREAQIHIPEAQRLPFASALARALDVARAWEE